MGFVWGGVNVCGGVNVYRLGVEHLWVFVRGWTGV